MNDQDSAVEPIVRVVVPCYNEAKRLDGDAFVAFVDEQPRFNLLFVNDGSRDETLAKLEALAAARPERIAVLDLPINQGKAEAVRQGVAHCLELPCDVVGYLDADLSTPLDELPVMLSLLVERPTLLAVTGSRVALHGRSIKRTLKRHYVGRLFATLVDLLLKLHVYDTQCGAKLFRSGPPVHKAFAAPFRSRWIFDVELLHRLKRTAEADSERTEPFLREHPLEQWHDVAGSKLRLRDFFRAGIDLLRIWRHSGDDWTA